MSITTGPPGVAGPPTARPDGVSVPFETNISRMADARALPEARATAASAAKARSRTDSIRGFLLRTRRTRGISLPRETQTRGDTNLTDPVHTRQPIREGNSLGAVALLAPSA